MKINKVMGGLLFRNMIFHRKSMKFQKLLYLSLS